MKSNSTSAHSIAPVAGACYLVVGLSEEVANVLPHGWAELVELLGSDPEADPMSRVQRLCALCVQATGVAGAALSVTHGGTRSTVCTTDDLGDLVLVAWL